jgi:alpha-glucosidase
MMLTIRGTPFLYYGEEIGMTCGRLPRAALRDPLGIATWPLRSLGRDPERTPMQWDASPNAGFTSGRPWLPVNPDFRSRNVAAQEGDPASLLSWYRSLISLRRSRTALREGSLAFLDLDPDVLAYERVDPRAGGTAGEERLVVLLNFASRRRRIALGTSCVVLLGSGRGAGSVLGAGKVVLGPCEIIIAEAIG